MFEKREGQSDKELLDWLMQEAEQVRERMKQGKPGADRKNTKSRSPVSGMGDGAVAAPVDQRSRRTDATPKPGGRTRRNRTRAATSVLAPGHTVTTIPGSLYDSIFRALACVGQLSLHDAHFREFSRRPTVAAARKLLDAIGVYRKELEIKLNGDVQFKEHRRNRTTYWENRAASGNTKAQAVLSNPAIWGPHGWSGDVDEAISILSGCSSRSQYRTGRNLAIARRARVTFDVSQRDQDQVLYLYPIQYRRLFETARKLASE